MMMIIIIISLLMFMMLLWWHSHCGSSLGSCYDCSLSVRWLSTI